MAKKDIITIEFHGHNIETFKSEGSEWVSIRSICEGMGLDVQAQHRKLQKRQDKFNYSLKAMVAQDGKTREVQCIPVKKVPGWLFTLDADRVKPEAKQSVELFQAECFDVLYDYWHGGESAPAHPVQQALALPDFTRRHVWVAFDSTGNVCEHVELNSTDAVRTQVDKHFHTAALLERGAVIEDLDHVADLLLEMTSRVKNTLSPLITALGTTTHATQSEANAFWRKRRERSFTRLAATVGGAA